MQEQLKEFIDKSLSLVCNSTDSELNKLFFRLAKEYGLVEENKENYDFVINGIRYKKLPYNANVTEWRN